MTDAERDAKRIMAEETKRLDALRKGKYRITSPDGTVRYGSDREYGR